MLQKYRKKTFLKTFLLFTCVILCVLFVSHMFLVPKPLLLKTPNRMSGTDDYSKLIDLTNFSFRTLSEVCRETTKVLVIVSSAPENVGLRNAIRSSWGQNTSELATVFAVGLASNKSQGIKLQEENNIHQDLIQGMIRDSLKTMSYKRVLELKYAVYHCPSTKFVLRTDDDVFVNTPYLMEFLDNYAGLWQNSIFCCLKRWSKPDRSSLKAFVTYNEYPERTYPAFCQGGFTLVHFEVLKKLYQQAQNEKYFWVDDVFLTGIVARNIAVKHFDVRQWILTYSELFRIFVNASVVEPKFLLGKFHMRAEHMLKLWSYVKQHP